MAEYAIPPQLQRRTRADVDSAVESSIVFVVERLDDETLVYSVQFDGGNPVELQRANYDEHGSSGMDMLETTVERTAAAIGVRYERR